MIGDNIKFYRKKNQLTQDDIAEACNVTRQAVSKWENGKAWIVRFANGMCER